MDESTLIRLAIEECIKIAEEEANRCRQYARLSKWPEVPLARAETAQVIIDKIKALLTNPPETN